MKQATLTRFIASSLRRRQTYWALLWLLLTFAALALVSVSYISVLEIFDPQELRTQISQDPFSDASVAALSALQRTLMVILAATVIYVLLSLLLYVAGTLLSLSTLYATRFSWKLSLKLFIVYASFCAAYLIILYLAALLLAPGASAIVFLCVSVLFIYFWLFLPPFAVLSGRVRHSFSMLFRQARRMLAVFFVFGVLVFVLFALLRATLPFVFAYLLLLTAYHLILSYLAVHKRWIHIRKP